jgi:hypothetical protein
MKNKFTIVISIAVILVLGILVWLRVSKDDFDLPKGERETETTSISETSDVMLTDGVKHSVPLSEIISGGPPKDGIPSIDDPQFVSVGDADDWLSASEPGIAVSIDGINRFYPYQILVWHEIVNDLINGKRILVTYCPLCLTGYVFDPVVQDERVEFGTSGRLWNSNLVMYDRKTDSLWSQILGEAIVGSETGNKLIALPSDQMLYGNWKNQFPDGEVLSRDTGATRFYGTNPYDDYFKATDFAVRMAGFSDTRLSRDAFVFGIVDGEQTKAYAIESIKKVTEVRDIFASNTYVLRYDTDLDVVRMFQEIDGTEKRINPFSSFWFSWVAVHPDTELYK